MIIDEIYDYIIENIEDVTSSNTFKAYMPDSPDNMIGIFDTGGAEPNRDIPTGDPTFQIMVRNTNYETGHDLMQSIADLLHRKTNLQLVDDGTYFYNIYLMGEPGHLGRDENSRDEWSANFICHIRR